MRSKLVALLVAGIWITALCTAPNLLGSFLWNRFGFRSELPLSSLLQVTLNSIAVLSFLLVTRRAALLRFTRPERPSAILFLLPLVALNVLRGPLGEFTPAFWAVVLATNFLIGFWEEFLFRGLIQDRLAVLGPRLSLLAATAMFALIHAHSGLIRIPVTFSIGLAFALTRPSLGMWPLVIVHALIDVNNQVFLRRWPPFQTVAWVVLAAYLAVGLLVLLRRRAG